MPKTGGAQFGVRKTGLQNWEGAQNCQKTGVPNCPQLGVPKPGVHKSGGAQNLPHPPPRKPVTPTSPRPCRRGPQQQTQTKNCHTHLPERLLLAKAQQKQTQTKNCHTHLPESLSQRPLSNKHKQRIAAPTNTNEELPHLPPREPVAKAPQQQTQTKNCCAHLRKGLLSQRPCSNKHKRRIATPTSPRACRKSRSATNTNEELPHPPPREPVAKALQQQTQKKNRHTHLPESLSQKPLSNKHKRRIAAPTSPRACCRKGAAETNTNEELCARPLKRGCAALVWPPRRSQPTLLQVPN